MGENMLTILREMMESARKNGYPETAKAVSTVIGDLQRVNKDYISRSEMLGYIKAQFKASAAAELKAKEHGVEYTSDYEYDSVLCLLLDEYSPPQLSGEQLAAYFTDLLGLNPSINKGMMMKALRQEFPDSYDGKQAAILADSVLKRKN